MTEKEKIQERAKLLSLLQLNQGAGHRNFVPRFLLIPMIHHSLWGMMKGTSKVEVYSEKLRAMYQIHRSDSLNECDNSRLRVTALDEFISLPVAMSSRSYLWKPRKMDSTPSRTIWQHPSNSRYSHGYRQESFRIVKMR